MEPTSSGEVRAEFELDEGGKPAFIQGKRLKHYKIRLSVDAVPDQAQSVTYRLHDSYKNPVREVFRGERGGHFDESITSFGDFDVQVSPSGSYRASSKRLSDALRESARRLAGDLRAIEDALRDIEMH